MATSKPSYAPVAPLEVLRSLAHHGLLGHYQLLIAPVVLDRAWEYEQFFRPYDDQTIILDNGVIELGAPLAPAQLAQAASIVNADVVVLPDTIDNATETVKQAARALPDFRKMMPGRKALGVVQGLTIEECLWCAEALDRLGVDWLAIPRGLTKNLKTRVPLVKEVAERYNKPIHVLGFSDNIKDDIEAAACDDRVFGIDAATPTWAGEQLPPAPPSDEPSQLNLGKRPTDFWTRPTVPTNAILNVAVAREWLSTAVVARTHVRPLADPVDPSTQTW